MQDDATVTDGIDELARDETRQRGFDIETRRERRDCGRGDRLAEDGERLHRDARRLVERSDVPSVLTEPAARELAAQTERDTARTTERCVEAFDGSELF